MPQERIVLLSPPKYDHTAWAAHKAKDGVSEDQIGRREDLCEAYAERCVNVASQKGTKIVDVCAAMKAREVSTDILVEVEIVKIHGFLTKILDSLTGLAIINDRRASFQY